MMALSSGRNSGEGLVCPIVSVGIPVRNGAGSLARALDSVLTQTFRQIEVIISDNSSTDDTPKVIATAAADPRVRAFRQERPLTGMENFRFVLDQAQGEYFMWAAHDDWRTPNYIEALFGALQRNPDAVLASAESLSCPEADLEFAFPADPFFCDVETLGMPLFARLRKQAQRGCVHVYGLIRIDSLRGYRWYAPRLSPDRPLLNWLAAQGPFVRAEAGRFLYFNPGKSREQSAQENFYEGLDRWARERCVWASARAVTLSTWRKRRVWLPSVLAFLLIYLWEARGFKNALYPWLPAPALRLWRGVKSLRRSGRGESHGERGQ